MRTKMISGGKTVLAKQLKGGRALQAITGNPETDRAEFDRRARDLSSDLSPCRVIEVDGRLYLEVD